MIKCEQCAKLVNHKNTTYRLEHKEPIKPKGTKITHQQQVCKDCFEMVKRLLA